jgi:hypothetical protein
MRHEDGRQAGSTSTNKRMAVPGSKQPCTQMPAALVVVCIPAYQPSKTSVDRREYYINIGGHFAMRHRCSKCRYTTEDRAEYYKNTAKEILLKTDDNLQYLL